MVEGLIEAGASVHDRGRLGRTPLHVAAMHGHDAVVEALLALKADPRQVDNNEWNPLRYAEEGGHWGVMAILTGKKKLPLEERGINKRPVGQRKKKAARDEEAMNKGRGGLGGKEGVGGGVYDDLARASGSKVFRVG